MIKLDRIDLKILAALQRDGRITKLRLAEAISLSPAACWARMRRLEEAGVIAGYSANIDPALLDHFVTVLVEIALKSHHLADFQRFEAMARREPAIVGCDAVGGGIDYVLRIVAGNIDAYQHLIDRLLAENFGIDRYFTYIVTKSIKASGFPLALLKAQETGSES